MMPRARLAALATFLTGVATMLAAIAGHGDLRIVAGVIFGCWALFFIIARIYVHRARERLRQAGLLDEQGRWKGDPKYDEFLKARHKRPPNEKP